MQDTADCDPVGDHTIVINNNNVGTTMIRHFLKSGGTVLVEKGKRGV